MATGCTNSLIPILQAKNHQSAGLDIIEQESHLLMPGFNIVHTSINSKKVLKILKDYYVELKLRSIAGQHNLLLAAGTIDNYYDACLCYEIFNFGPVPFAMEKGFAYIQVIYHQISRPNNIHYSLKTR